MRKKFNLPLFFIGSLLSTLTLNDLYFLRLLILLIFSGCVIAEIRDHRNHNSENNINEAILSHHVLLRPSTQSLICDGNLICERSNLHSKEDRIHVESQLCLATQGPLCLDPDPVVSIIAR